MRVWLGIGSLVALLLALPGASQALSISDPTLGGTYSLNLSPVDADTWVATFSIDLAAVPLQVPATSINQIEFKVANTYIPPITVLSAPDAAGNWVPTAGPLTGSGCNGKNDGFVCLSTTSPLAIGSTTSFTWQVQFDAVALLPESDWHIGVRYTSPTHQRGWVVSLSPAPIPEPASGLLLGTGLLIVGAAARRRLD